MATTLGMTPEEVRQLAQQMQTSATTIRDAASQLSNLVANVAWIGPDADRFRSTWDGQHAPALQQIAQSLDDTATVANQNADDQEATSNA